MPHFRIPTPAIPLLLLLLLSSSLIAAGNLFPDPLFTSCSGDKFTSPSPFASSLRSLLETLISITPNTPNLFSAHTSGKSAQASGLAQCRPDASAAVCSGCLSKAADFIVNISCRGMKSASVRNNYCVLRYADHVFDSVLEFPSFNSTHSEESASNPAKFSLEIESLLEGIMQAAVSSPLRIAAGMNHMVVDPGKKKNSTAVYGMAWCTADLSPENCYQCLDHALKSYIGCCGDKIEGESATVSCILGYSNHPFFNLSLIPAKPALLLPPPSSETGKRRLGQREKIIIAVSISAAIVSTLVVFIILIFRRRRALQNTSKIAVEKENMGTLESHLLPLASIKSATNNFSDENKLREGRFGPVYKGVLSDGQQVLVKRLSKTSGQRLVELKNEADLVAQLQHKNLVKLLGCCAEEEENLLIYEYLPNSSLDKHLYDPAKRSLLDWETRHLIMEGIARGLVYLHNHSRVRIIHRDLNSSNILLDGGMNPKISDFGLAKLVGVNESQWDTKQAVGTLRYMAPEYATRGLFSTKSDVFSYGMVVLEIITGRRNGSFTESGGAFNLQTYVWQSWNQEKSEQVIDPGLHGQYLLEKVLRCINIGLLCIQSDPAERPSMATVVLMLSTDTETLPAPSLPAYFTGGKQTGLSSESPSNYSFRTADTIQAR